MQKFQDVLDGKVKREDLTPEEMPDFYKFAGEKAKEEEGRVAGLREAKRTEQERADKAKADAEAEEERLRKIREGNQPKLDPAMQQFRSEQVFKAKTKLLSSVKLTDEEMRVVEEKFSRLDTGKLDADLIYVDYVSAVAAANPEKYLMLTNKQQAAEQAAAEEEQRQAASGGGSSGGGGDDKKYSDEVKKLSKDAGISLEAAQKQITQGNKRVY